jgi:acetyl-CoA synthetase
MTATDPMLPPMKDYRAIHEAFRWRVPETFNFGADVVDYHAAREDGWALVWSDAAGREECYRYSDISRLTSRFASMLATLGVAKSDRVIVMTPRTPHWQIAIVGCLKLGAVPIPCIEMLTAGDLDYRIRHSGAVAAFTLARNAEKFAGLHGVLPVRVAVGAAEGWGDYDALMAAADEGFAPVTVAAEDPAILYYTSGSTGHPKGVTHAARALYAWRVSAAYWLDLSAADTIWCTADVGWSKAGTSILFGPWSRGACSFFHDGPFEPRERLRLLEKYGITVYCAAGTELYRVVEEDAGDFDLSKLRLTVSAGESVNPVISARWRQVMGMPVSEAYGQTETLMTVLNYPSMPVKPGSMGLPSPGTVADVLDAKGRRLPIGEEGHLAILTPNPQIMLGYRDDPARTAESFIDGPDGRWFLTGDLARRDEEGYFFYTGRSDDVINSAGYRIGPLEVENALLEHDGVLECAAVASPDPERGQIVKAFIVLRAGVAGTPALATALQDHAKRVTAPYKYPRAIEFVEALPKTATGKIRRRALRDREYVRACHVKIDTL